MSLITIIEKLRELNKVVDTTKGTLQIQILALLKNGHDSKTARELSTLTKRRRKSVTDALWKLKSKGLIDTENKNGEVAYRITPKGTKYVEELITFFKPDSVPDVIGGLSGVVELLPLFYYTYDAVVALGMADDSGLSLKELSNIFGLSLDRTETYMDLFTNAPGARLFRKMNELEPRYCLTEDGKRVFSNLSQYKKMERLSSSLFSFITRSKHPKKTYARLSAELGLGSFLTSLLTIISGSFIPLWIWISFVLLIGTIVLFDFLSSFNKR
ncbi:MAG: winged helix DNA-binding protein [Candidatus Methanomethyliaceae archaeon]|nr:winged helix DNA-binding protein [Candidatus Methanomethyliaceae archaeon]